MTKLDINQIRRYLPHRYPFLLIDVVEDVVPGESIRARKCVTANEHVFSGHFPGNPVLPGVLQIEAMCQAAALLAMVSGEQVDPGSAIYVTGVDACRFRRPVVPGDVLEISVKIAKRKMRLWRFACECRVGTELVSEAVVSAAAASGGGRGEIPEGLPPPPVGPMNLYGGGQ